MTESVNEVMIRRLDEETRVRPPRARPAWIFNIPLTHAVSFSDGGIVYCDNKDVGVIAQGPSGLWRFWRHTPEGVTPLPGYYPTYAVAEVGVRAYLENEDEPEIGNPHHGE